MNRIIVAKKTPSGTKYLLRCKLLIMTKRYASQAMPTKVQSQILCDPLATDRTILANERTMLAYIRTAVTVLVGGFSLISFFPAYYMKLVGWLSLIPAVYLFYLGAKRYYILKQVLSCRLKPIP